MTVPDFTNKTVRLVLRMANEMSLEVDIRGSGRACPGFNMVSINV
jgi:hypothetical protein